MAVEFGIQFHPTPQEVIQIMLEPYKKLYNEQQAIRKGINYTYNLPIPILDPSAGKGDILDYCNNYVNKEDLYAIEIDTNLQILLEDKAYSLLETDFLQFNNTVGIPFGLILMNPPFHNGDQHLLKAFEISRNTDIVCLLNAETILNPYTQSRELLLKIIEDYGSYELLGQCFSSSENPTNVEVALVRIKKTTESKFDFNFETINVEQNEEDVKEDINVSVQKPEYFEDLNKRQTEILDCFKKASYYQKQLFHHLKMISFQTWNIKIEDLDTTTLAKKVNIQMWSNIIKRLELNKYMTHDVQKDFNDFIYKKGLLEINQKNVLELLDMVVDNRESIFKQAIVSVFNIFTKYYKENRCHIEGWVTNDQYKVNRKIILPRWLSYGSYMTSDSLKNTGDRLRIESKSEYGDIDKVMCYLTGLKYENISTIYNSIYAKCKFLGYIKTGDKFDNTCESTFFEIKLFRKGTIHLIFKDEDLWHEFNYRACLENNWLNPEQKKSWKRSKKSKSGLFTQIKNYYEQY